MAAVRYLVADVDAAVEFYTSHLGFRVERRMGAAFAVVAREDLRLWLSGPGTSAARPMADGAKPGPGGWNRLVLEVGELARRVEEMKSAGVRFRSEIVSGPGGKQVLALDPSGNIVELFEPSGS